MYEVPTITEIGKASEVILGIAAVGSDLDGCWLPGDADFADDNEPSSDGIVGE